MAQTPQGWADGHQHRSTAICSWALGHITDLLVKVVGDGFKFANLARVESADHILQPGMLSVN
jgi:hypothetical protein